MGALSGRAALLAGTACAALLAPAAVAADWRALPDAPDARTELAGVAVSGKVVVAGGFTADGGVSRRVDLYDPRRRWWSRLPDLPIGVHHAMAASYRGRPHVIGGYRRVAGADRPSDRAWVLVGRRWRPLPRLPEPRAAGGAALVGRRIYVTGGVGADGLARRSLVLDLGRRAWSRFAGLPGPREHLGVARRGRLLFVVGGRTRGLESNTRRVDAYHTLRRRWNRLPDAPTPRGGNAAAHVSRLVVAVGGEGPDGTIAEVDAHDPRRRRWRRLDPSPAPRHGLGMVALGHNLFQALGGPTPGLDVSPSLLTLRVPPA